MFLTGFSSPFISIFLALVLPWLVVVFGKNSSLQITSESNNLIRITETQPVSNDFQSAFSYKKTERKTHSKQGASFFRTENIFEFIVEKPDYEHPVNHTIYPSEGTGNTESRGPPSVFTI